MIELGFKKKRETLSTRRSPRLSSVWAIDKWEYLRGDGDHEEMVFRGICATRQLAKRESPGCAAGKHH